MAKSASNVIALPRSTRRPKLVRDPLADLSRSVERHLRAKHSEHTIATYLVTVRQFGDYMNTKRGPQETSQVQR